MEMEYLTSMTMTWMEMVGPMRWRTSVVKTQETLPVHLKILMAMACVTTSIVTMTTIHSLTLKRLCVTLTQRTNSLFQSMMTTMEFVMLYNLIETWMDGQMVQKNPVALTQMMHPVFLLILTVT